MMDEHFWLFCGLWVGFGNGLIIWARRHRLSAENKLTEGDVKRAAMGVALWVLLPCAVLWLLQLSAGPSVGPNFSNWPSPQKDVALALQASAWVALLVWVFLRGGDQAISLYLPVVGSWPAFMSTPTAVRIGTALMVLCGAVAIFAAHGQRAA